MHATAPIFQTTDGKARYIVKNTPVTSVMDDGRAYSASFKYYKSIYRLSQVYLRYAEAINRAGYPRTAFAILRDGINFNNMPKLLEDKAYDDDIQTWHYTYDLDSVKTAYGVNYIGADEMYRAQNEPEYANFIDFSTNIWNNSSIHGHPASPGPRTVYLSRTPRHRDVAGQVGTQWLAWKIARRNELLKPYEVPTQYNATLYNLLLNTGNWYIPNPQY